MGSFQIDIQTTISLIETTLAPLGLSVPDLPGHKDLPGGKTTPQDVVAAIKASKAADPYKDPAVQKLWIALQLQSGTSMYETNLEMEANERLQVVKDAAPALVEQLNRMAQGAAEVINDNAAPLVGIADLRNIQIGTDAPSRVHAALDIQVACADLAAVLKARQQLWSLTPRIPAGGPEILEWANPTVSELGTIDQLGPRDYWTVARAGVEINVVTTREQWAERAQAHTAEQRRIQAARARQAEAQRNR